MRSSQIGKTCLNITLQRDGTQITDFALCDFRSMFEHFEAEKAKKKALTSAEKKEMKAVKDKMEAPYTHCVLDGRKEKVGNFRVEPPGLFRGRGDHPRKGALKVREILDVVPKYILSESISFVYVLRTLPLILDMVLPYQHPICLANGRMSFTTTL